MSAGEAIDLTALNEDQQLALQQFTSVTDQNLTAAIPLLQKCQWNVQIAITRFFDGDAGTIDPVAEAARAAPGPPSNSRRAETLIDTIPGGRSYGRNGRRTGTEEAPRVVPTPGNQLHRALPFPFNIFVLPVNLAYIICQRLLSSVGYAFPFIPRLLARFWTGRVSRPSRDTGRRALSPRDTAERFIREFEEEYSVSHGRLPFFEGGYANAFDVAKRELKFLLVVLLSPEHDDTGPFVRQTLLSQEFVDFVSNPQHELMLWGGTVQDAESYQIAHAFHVTKFPYTCLIVHTPSVSSTAMSKVVTTSGLLLGQELVRKLQTAMTAQTAELDRVRRQRSEQQASRNLRQEQESAYERSLAQDREKMKRRKEEERLRAAAEKEEADEAKRKADLTQKIAQWRAWRAQSIDAEPAASVKDAVRISIRMLDGQRVVRRFNTDAKLEDLYAFIECYALIEQELVNEKHISKPEHYKHEYQFRLVSPMPRTVYELDESNKTIREQIGRSGNLIVESTAADEEDELNEKS